MSIKFILHEETGTVLFFALLFYKLGTDMGMLFTIVTYYRLNDKEPQLNSSLSKSSG